jgi:NADPH2:quinone reductase
MRALLCRSYGPLADLRVEEVDDPVPGRGKVVIDVAACGANYLDGLIVQGKYQVKPPLPFSPGGEVAGTIAAVGEGVTQFKAGDTVTAATGFGGFAEKVIVDAVRVLPIPPDADFVAIASAGLVYGTALHALEDRGALVPGETLLVLGASGGVGLASLEVGRMLGARVIAAASTGEKRALCLANGADAVIDYTNPNWRDLLKTVAPKGVDVVLDAVGGPATETAIRCLNWRGRHLVVGFAHGDIPAPPLNLIMLKGASSVGVFWGAFLQREPAAGSRMMSRIVSMVADGRIKPHVSATYPLDRSVEALEALLGRTATGKLVITPP